MKKITSAWWLWIILCLALILDLAGVVTALRFKFLATGTPLLQSTTWVRWQLNRTFTRIGLLSQASKQVIVLQNELTRVQSLQSRLQTLEAENQALRQQLGLPPATRPKLVATTIISYPEPLIQLPADETQLVGSAVIGQGMLLGFVKTVDASLGTVEVLSSPTGRRLLAKTSQGVQGLISFDGKNLTMTTVDRQADIKPDELVLTMGQPGVPADLAIGYVGKVISPLTAPTQTLIIKQPTTFYQEKVVEIRQL